MPSRAKQADPLHPNPTASKKRNAGVLADTPQTQMTAVPAVHSPSFLIKDPAVSPSPQQRSVNVVSQAPPVMNRSTSPSAAGEHAQGTQYGGHVSPVQLTELMSGAQKTCCPPSDRNHNVTTLHAGLLQLSDQHVLQAGDGLHVYDCTEPLVCKTEDVHRNTDTYYGDREVPHNGLFSASDENYIYYKGYHQQYTVPASHSVCQSYSFSSVDTGREYSSPEMNAYSHTSSTHTSPLNEFSTPSLNASSASAASPDSVQWSLECSTVHPISQNTYMLPGSADDNGSSLHEETAPDTSSYISGNGSSAHASYYSDEQSLEGDSMRDIQQEILRADIHKHIYENYSENMIICQPDEDTSLDQTEDCSADEHSSHRKSSTGSKKRRRRTQTPGQRTAANMRERKRMCHLNVAFESLKDRLPNVRNRKKLSRIQTLKAAMFYIGLLSECLHSS